MAESLSIDNWARKAGELIAAAGRDGSEYLRSIGENGAALFPGHRFAMPRDIRDIEAAFNEIWRLARNAWSPTDRDRQLCVRRVHGNVSRLRAEMRRSGL